jgi:hypothetical protein
MPSFTLADISGALSRLFDVSPDHPALTRFAGQLEPVVNTSRDIQRSGLSGSGFQAVAITQIPQEVMDLMNPAKRQEAQRRQAENMNFYSADYAALAKFAGLPSQARQRDGGNGSSMEYAKSLPGEWTVGKLQSLARDLGVGWAANDPGLLQLGPSAIKLLAEMHFKEEMYKRLSSETGLSAKQVVGVVGYAKRTGQDANKVAGDVADVAKDFGGDDPEARKAAGRVIADHLAKPEDRAAGKAFDDLVRKHEKDSTKRASVEKAKELDKKAKKVNSAENAADAKSTVAKVKDAKVDEGRAKMEELLKKRQVAAQAPG